MKALFIANVNLNENEGIYKKIFAQAESLKHVCGEAWLLTKKNNGAKVYNFQENQSYLIEKKVIFAAREMMSHEQINIVYIRHMIPSSNLIIFLKHCRRKGIRIIYEIPTYPYFAEQYRTATKKYRAIAKILLDVLFWPLIYSNIDNLTIIKSNSCVKMYRKMISITNGVDIDTIQERNKVAEDRGKFSMVAVGTLYPYHGYDRILAGLQECNEKIGAIKVEMHFVGDSPTTQSLKKIAQEYGLNNVFFHGIKTTKELNEMYDMFDVGLGCLALHRRNADIDTTLKIIEYYCRGIPVVTSGKSPMDLYDPDVTIHVSDNDKPVNISEIYNGYISISNEKKQKIALTAKAHFSWHEIIKGIINV